MKKVAFYTLGCKVNQYDTEAMLELFTDRGYEVVEYDDAADVYVINTCTVTHMGDRKSRQMIRRALKHSPDAVIAVVGCYSQTAPLEVSGIEGVGVIIGTKDRLRIVELVEDYKKTRVQINAVQKMDKKEDFEDLNIRKLENQTRAYLKIQEGCNQYCAYCIIPFARGPIRSREPENVLDQVRKLAESGFKEIILTGIHIASYGKDLDEAMNLYEMIKQIHAVDGIERIRISSIEPNIFTEEFISNLSNLPKLCPHFHLSLQSGCDATLKRMNRKYDTKHYKEICQLLRRQNPNVAITTDVMVGFPGESDQEFEETVQFVQEIQFAQMHVFKYSPRQGTPAARWDEQISADVKEQRSKKLITISEEMEIQFIEKNLGEVMQVLFEEESNTKGYYEGYTPNYLRVMVPTVETVVNQILSVRLIERKGTKIVGEIIK